MYSRSRSSWGFTLVEAMVVVAIVAILSVISYAPYSYYSDLTRVRVSAEKVEQAFSEARLSSSMGLSLPGSDANADAYVVLVKGSGSVGLFAARSGSGFAAISDFRLLRSVPLEKNVVISQIPANTVIIKFSAPSGAASAENELGLPVLFSGGLVGDHGAVSGSLSRSFGFVSHF